MIKPRIGFCCKWLDPDTSIDTKSRQVKEAAMNQRATTLTALKKLTPLDREKRILSITQQNIETLKRQLNWLKSQPEELRLFRISSEFIPANTAEGYEDIMQSSSMHDVLSELNGIKSFADQYNIRLCMHPGQFTNISSDNPDVVNRAVDDLEYHGKLADYMGYGQDWHSSGFAINIHANSRQDSGLKRFLDIVNSRVSSTVRNLITLENDEFSCSVDDIVSSGIGESVALVLDIHHHWVESGGEYIEPTDSRCSVFRESWRGLRPLGHFSTSQESLLSGHCIKTKPDFKSLVNQGLKPGKLRSHSDLCWNSDVNDWAIRHLTWMDLEVEAKSKNLASHGLYEQFQSRNRTS